MKISFKNLRWKKEDATYWTTVSTERHFGVIRHYAARRGKRVKVVESRWTAKLAPGFEIVIEKGTPGLICREFQCEITRTDEFRISGLWVQEHGATREEACARALTNLRRELADERTRSAKKRAQTRALEARL